MPCGGREGCDVLLGDNGSSYLGLTGGEEGSLVSAEMQEAKAKGSIMPVKNCLTLHGEAQEATAFPSSNNLCVAAHTPRYLSGPEDQWLNAGMKLMGLV